MSDSALPRPPEILEGFRVGPLRRSAGALAVHAATDRLELPVELHILRISAMPGGAPAFLDVLRRATEVRHESLLPYVTGGRTDELLFAAAKTADAAALDEVLARGGGLDEDRVLAIGVQVAGVLAALDRAGLRHGDLTARRILLPGRGQVAVLPPRLVPASAAPRNDRYQSPEEARGGAGDIRSDLFVVGLLLTEALNGQPVLKVPSTEARRLLAEGQVTGDLSRARSATRSVLARLLAADPADRYPGPAAAEAALRAAAAGVEEAPLVADAPVPVPAPIPAAAQGSRGTPAGAAQGRGGPGGAAPASPAAGAQERPETAPVPRALVAQVLAQAAAASPPVPPTPAAQVPEPAAIRRSPGRFYLQGRLGETLLEIDESVHVGRPAGAIDVAARPEPFPESEFVIERTETDDVLRALRPPVAVNGSPVDSHVLRQGDTVAGPSVRGRYEASVRTALRATGYTGGPPPDPRPGRLMKLAALVIALAGIGLAVPRLTAARRAADEAESRAAASRSAIAALRAGAGGPGAAGGTATASPESLREKAARDALQDAKDWQRKNPGDAAGWLAKLREVAERYPDTGHGSIARAEVAEGERRTRGTGADGEFDKVLTDARRLADAGRLDEAMKSLQVYAADHPASVAGERAAAALTQIENEVLGRFEADAARAERALAQKDWNGALRIVSSIMDYAPTTLRDRARELLRRAEQGRDGGRPGPATQTDPVRPPGTTPPGPDPPGTGPDRPPGPGPGAGETPPSPEDRDREAEAAYRAARKLMEAGKDAEAIDALLGFLRTYHDTKPGAKYDGEVRSRVSALAEGPAGIQKLFRGKCEKLQKTQWRVTYDFSDPKQLEDFRDVEAFESPPRANWVAADGAVRGKGSGTFVLNATFLIDQLVTTASIVPERAHDLGIAFVDSSEPRRFYLYILQNTFFTLGRGESPKVFEENAIVLFGPAMWRDTPPGQIGFVRKCGSAEPAIRPSEATQLKCGKSDAQVWMRMEGGRQISGSAYGDVKLDFKGIEPALFVLNSGGSFDDLVIEGTPDPEWVRARWRAILSGL